MNDVSAELRDEERRVQMPKAVFGVAIAIVSILLAIMGFG